MSSKVSALSVASESEIDLNSLVYLVKTLSGNASKKLPLSTLMNNVLISKPCEFRLGLVTDNPFAEQSVVGGSTTLYFTPVQQGAGNIALYDTTNSIWRIRQSGEVTLSNGGLSAETLYDIYAYWTGSAVALEAVAWSGANTRATALTTQDSVYVKTGDLSRRYVGTIRTNTDRFTSNIECTGVTTRGRYVWNLYNQALTSVYVNEVSLTATWTYGTSAWRPANNDSANRVNFICGLNNYQYVFSLCACRVNCAASEAGGVGAGLNSTSQATGGTIAHSSSLLRTEVPPNNNGTAIDFATHQITQLGYNELYWLEYRRLGTITFTGVTDPTVYSGLTAWLLM
jgi:hypothetical protein